MHTKVYIDTNVLIDIFDDTRPFYKYSLDVIQTCFENEEIELFINIDTISNIFYLMRSQMKLSFDEALEKLEFIKNSFDVVYGSSEHFETTLYLCKKHIYKDFEDCFQYVCAIRSDCTLIVTNNPKDFKNSDIDVVTSKELSNLWNSVS